MKETADDFVTDGTVNRPRMISVELKDGTRALIENKTSLPDGAKVKYMMISIIQVIKQLIFITIIKKILP